MSRSIPANPYGFCGDGEWHAGSTKLRSIYIFGRNLCSGFFSGDSPDAVASDGGSVEIMYSFVAGLLPESKS